MLPIIAHAGESHSDSIESIAHYTAPWYIAIPVFILVTFAIAYLVWLVSNKDMGAVLLLIAGWLLLVGFGLYSISPVVSALSIVSGILIAGFLALAGLSSGK
jgi:hypothetical protein